MAQNDAATRLAIVFIFSSVNTFVDKVDIIKMSHLFYDDGRMPLMQKLRLVIYR